MLYGKTLNQALHQLMTADGRVLLLGEDLADPYGGAFKVTKGLSTAFPGRVLSTPISEAAITGVAGGLAMSGFRPIVEFMFGDFTTLAFDQVVNHLTKFGPMYAGQVSCPVILRTPMGGGRAYGPTHSQSLEKHFIGVPGLSVVGASLWHSPLAVLSALLERNEPTLLIEHKLMYGRECHTVTNGRCGVLQVEEIPTAEGLSTFCIRPVPRASCQMTVLAYGWSAELAVGLAEKLAVEQELFVEVVVPAQIYPLDWSVPAASLATTGRLLVCEEGTAGGTWGAEVALEMQRQFFGKLKAPVTCLSSERALIPSAPSLEKGVLLGSERIESKIIEMLA